MKGKGKSKGKGKGKDMSRAVNAYASNMFVGGLELSDSYELQSSSMSASNAQTGMLDCGATASAAPEGAVLAKDKSAKIEFDQSSQRGHTFGSGTGVGVELSVVFTCPVVCQVS